ncbi:MAG: sugar phosphate isomerase/epimerase [Defluviitaleaceae bacterium]|nr:sugar phosphate isomerase/epimerase [Defluviitaleaceae bacterium]MCL2240257.1 sugar phosphate isomerase/epimerase [Defluviitaleaceae bacterium]
MKIGAQLYTVRDFTQTVQDFTQTIKKVADIGYKYVQISGVGPIPAQEIGNICDAHDLDIIITHTPPGRILDDIATVIEEHHMMGAKYIGIGSMPGEYERTMAGVQRFIDDFAPIAEEIAKEGLTFMYHNHAFEFEKVGNKRILEHLMAGLPEAGFTLDTYWVQYAGAGPAAWIRKLKGRVPVIHLKDMAIVEEKQRMCEVMEGNLPWPMIFASCIEAGVEYGMVEQDDCYGVDPFESLKISYDHLKGVV